MNYQIPPWRWHLKKLARRGAVLSASLNRPMRLRKPQARLTVLTFHRFDGAAYDPVSVSSRSFEDYVSWLKDNVEVLDERGFIQVMEGKTALTRDSVLITVDDGHRSFYEKAFPLLKRYHLPAIVFVCPGLIGAGANAQEFMTWNQLAEIKAAGIQVSSHGYSHRSLARLSPGEAESEIVQAKEALELQLGADSPCFSLPFGTRRDFSQRLADTLLARGYRYCFTSIHGACKPLASTNLLPRAKIEGGESLSMFRSIVSGGLDGWRLVDDWAWPIQQRGRF